MWTIILFLYLGLEVSQAFPCQCDLTSSTDGPAVEREVFYAFLSQFSLSIWPVFACQS